MPKAVVITTTRLPEDVYLGMKYHATRLDRSLNNLITFALRRWLEAQKEQPVPAGTQKSVPETRYEPDTDVSQTGGR